MPIFISLPEKQRVNLFKQVKNNINCSWENFYPILRISRSSFYNYLGGRYFIPKNIFIRLENIAKIKVKKCSEIYRERYIEKKIKLPKMDSFLSEIFGVLNGDGHISQVNYEICVVGNLLEKEYYNYLKKLFENNLNLKFNIKLQNTHIKLRGYSKNLSNHLTIKYKLPKGNKLGQLKIPKQVFNHKNYIYSYIRGLYDTDGSFYIRRKKDPVVQITSADPIFLEEIRNTLISLDFHVAKGNQRIFIYNKKDIKRFFKEIKPANTKHLKKYQNYLKL